jgi:nicotinate-nucleotide adenylyltransferase
MAASGENILLFGGTFDPIHRGHLAIVEAITQARPFDRVVLIPSRQPPHKQEASASVADRLAMLTLAIAEHEHIEIDDVELSRPGPSYTIDTARAMRERFGANAKLNWLIGADMLADLDQWYCVEELVELMDFVIALRRPWHDRLDEIFDALAETFGPEPIAMLRANLIDTPLVDVSSTQVRVAVGAGESVESLVPTSVADYITLHHLYR